MPPRVFRKRGLTQTTSVPPKKDMRGGRSWSYSMSRYPPLRVVGEGHAPIGGFGHPRSGTCCCCVVINIRRSVPHWVQTSPSIERERERESIDRIRRYRPHTRSHLPRRKNSIMVIICATCFFLAKYPMPYCTTFNMPARRYNFAGCNPKSKTHFFIVQSYLRYTSTYYSTVSDYTDLPRKS